MTKLERQRRSDFIKKVIYSCKSQDQLDSCKLWIRRMKFEYALEDKFYVVSSYYFKYISLIHEVGYLLESYGKRI